MYGSHSEPATPPKSMEASPLLSQPSIQSSPDSQRQEKEKRAKLFALAAACVIPFGAHYVKQSLAPLRPFFENAGTSSYHFGLLLSAASWPNLFQPFLAGLFIDSKGHEHGSIVFTALALFGHAIFAASLTSTGVDQSAIIQAVGGRMLFGLGSGGSGVVQGAIVGHHFDDDITFAVGMTESVHYLAKWLGKATPVPIANAWNGSFTASIWIGCAFALLSCLTAVFYVISEELRKPFTFALNPKSNGKIKRHVSLETITSNTSELVADDPSYFKMSWDTIRALPWSFWALSVLHLLFSNISSLFAGFSTSYLVETFGLSPQTAAYYASIDAFVPIFMAPLIGRYIDKNGGRLGVCATSGLMCGLSFMLLLNVGNSMPLGPLIPVLLISFATCTTPALIKAGVPLVAPREALGTAFSIYSVFEALGASIGHVGLGYLRDLTSTYATDLYILLGISLLSSAATLVVRYYDATRLDGLLNERKSDTGLIL